MKKSSASPRYTRALFQLSVEKNALDKVYQDIRRLKQLLEDTPPLRAFFEYPQVSSEQRLATFDKLFKTRFHALTLQFFHFLERKDRLALTAEICSAFETMYLDHKNILKAHITSSQTLTEHQVAALKNRLQERFRKDIVPEIRIDPTLVGGFKVQIEDRIMDLSIAGQLEKFKRKVLNA